MGWDWFGIALVVGMEQRRPRVHFLVRITGSKVEFKMLRPLGQVEKRYENQGESWKW